MVAGGLAPTGRARLRPQSWRLSACGPVAAGPHGGAAAGGDVSLHNFSGRLWGQIIHFHVMQLMDSLFLWVWATPHLRNLTMTMCNRYDSIPVSTSLLGDTSNMTSIGFAQRLARKTNKQVFVSYNLQNTDSNFPLLVQNRIKEEMKAFQENFWHSGRSEDF
ncbi:proteasome assembly chaperone 4-like isoform X1 [Canis lupus familiaris]|nr:proteasome assembly chaperone 4-like isoform X1 [Canis lupus familiaris]|eukprot:XP_005625050.1 proteasome assembly chaperone 4-like [Canis lupus familiaris]